MPSTAPLTPEPDPKTGAAPMRWHDWVVLAVLIVGCLPPVVLRYVPMTDLPQHLSVATVLAKHADPTLEYAKYFDVEYGRTLYLVPYAMTLALGKLLPMRAAIGVVAALAMAAFPLGLFAFLRALGRPTLFALLGLVIVYNRSVFWGFLNFELSMGMALMAMAWLVSPPRWWRALGIAMTGAALAFTHTHGGVLLVAFTGLLWLLARDQWPIRRCWPVSVAALGCLVWAGLASRVPGFGTPFSPRFSERLNALGHAVLGGYSDGSDLWLFWIFVGLVAYFSAHVAPLDRERLALIPPALRVVWILVTANVLLYFTLPENTYNAKLIHFRHAVMAAMLAPALCSLRPQQWLLQRVAAAALGIAALFNAWVHWIAYDQEARSFDEVLAAIPPAPRILSLSLERDGAIMGTAPYVHFGAYALAERGGDLSISFAHFWNVPIHHKDSGPRMPDDFEWFPETYDGTAIGSYFTHALLRTDRDPLVPSKRFPFRLILRKGEWQLYAYAPPGESP